MAQTTIQSQPDSLSSGAGLDFLTDQNALTLAAVGTGVATFGGSAFIATAVAPGYVIGGTVATGLLATGGHLKQTTGSYLPFLKDKEEVKPSMAPAA